MRKRALLLLLLGFANLIGCRRAQPRSIQELSETLARLDQTPAKVNRYYDVPKAARLSINLGNIPLAKTLVQEEIGLARAVQNPDERMRYLHPALINAGRIALREHRLEDAKADLLAAGQTLSLGHPKWFLGPDMALAKELLEAAEYRVVLDYLALCQRYCPSVSTQYWRVSIWFGFLPAFSTLI